MDQKIGNEYTAVVLAAGYGSRISGMTSVPKCLLSLGGETLLERNFRIWKSLGIKKVSLVLGYEADQIKKVCAQYDNDFEFSFRLNEDFKNLGNTYSLLKGIESLNSGCLIFDADLAYEDRILKDFLESSLGNEILLGEGDLNDIECAKALVDEKNFVRKTVDKRAVTSDELEQFSFAGEAIGILKFDKDVTSKLEEAAIKFLDVKENQIKNWEHLLNEFLPNAEIGAFKTDSKRWVEIDTPEDFKQAESIFYGS